MIVRAKSATYLGRSEVNLTERLDAELESAVST